MATTQASQPAARLPKPRVPALLPDGPQWEEVGLLPVADAQRPLPVEIPEWEYIPITGRKTVLHLYWITMLNKQLVTSREWESDLYPDAIPAQDRLFEVPPGFFAQGSHEFCYELFTPSLHYDSFTQLVTIDLIPPTLGGNQGQLLFPAPVMQDGVTFDWLADNGDVLSAQVPVYQTPKAGDMITWYWSDTHGGTSLAGSRTLAREDIGLPIDISFPGELIRERGDGQRYASYKIQDRAGNISSQALAVRLDVKAIQPPRQLPRPKLNGTGSTTLVPVRGIDGVTLVIPEEAVLYDTDHVFMQWAEPDSIGAWRTDVEVAPRQYRVPASQVPQHLGSELPVYYEAHAIDGSVHPSAALQLQVSVLEGLPALQCDRIYGQKISIRQVEALGSYASFSVGSWSFMATGQFINVTVLGKAADGIENLVIPVLEEEPVVQLSNPLPTGRISADSLKRFLQNSELRMEIKVSFDDKRSWKPFLFTHATLVA